MVDPSAPDASLDIARAPLPSYPVASQPVAVAAGEMRWSDPATWGGTLPGNGAEVVIPAGRTIVLDTNTASLGALRIDGTLKFAPVNLELTARSIRVGGAMLAGEAGNPYVHRALITLTGAPTTGNDGVSRGLNVQGGRLELRGAAPQPVWTRLNDHAAAGTNSLILASTTNWRENDLLAVAPSDFYGADETERVTFVSMKGKAAQLANALTKPRWGKLQHLTNTGLSLNPDPSYTPPAAPAPTVLDERAAVANLSRNIVIQGADDAHWAQSGFGAHVMVMDLRSKVVIDGVEFRRVGQAGQVGRYPFHWHMLSYVNGVMVGDAVGHVIRNSSVWNSSNRCIVVHGTNGTQVRDNVCHDIKGHAFFLEDAVERRNVFQGNIALKIRKPDAGRQLQVHEGDVYLGGPSGFWLTNPDNVVRGNLAADAYGNGFWLAYPKRTLGASKNVPLQPQYMRHGTFEYNVAHSSRGPGILLNWVPDDDAGNVVFNQYAPTVDETPNNYANLVKIEMRRMVSYKNMQGGYQNNVMMPEYLEWTLADNVGVTISGKVFDGLIARSLLVGTSLNNWTPYPSFFPYEKPSAFATYHSTLAMKDNTILNFPFHDGEISGAWKTDDYYITGVDRGPVRNPNNRLIASHAGFRVLPPALDGKPIDNRHWTLSGALWDPYGYAGPKGNYHVYDVPFLTAGANCQWVAPAGKNGKTCDGEYFGVDGFQTDFDTSRYAFLAPLEAVRLDTNGAEIGRWSIGDGATSTKLGNMRHFAARPGGRYVIRFPNRVLPKSVAFQVRNAYRSGDSVVFAVAFNGGTTATGYSVSGFEHNRENPPDQRYVRTFQPASSLAEVVNGAGDRMWQDRAANVVWIKHQGGMPFPNEAALAPNSDDALYRPVAIVLRGQ
jgi:hypothetical protein